MSTTSAPSIAVKKPRKSAATKSATAKSATKSTTRSARNPATPRAPRKLTDAMASQIVHGDPTKPVEPPPAPQPQLTNHVAFVIDNSSSMGSLRGALVRAYNQNLQTIKSEVFKNTTSDGKSDQHTTLTQVFFGYQVEHRFVAAPVDTLRSMREDEYRPNGNTPLLDAVGTTIEKLEALPDANSKDTSFLVIVLTDGDENASSHHWRTQLADKMRRCQATDRWSFVFLVPDARSRENLVRAYNVPDGNVLVWATSAEGTQQAGASVSRGISGYYSARAAGQHSVKGFFQADLSGVKKKDLDKLENLRQTTGRVRVLSVKTEAEIKPFVESETGESYVKGGAFYELVKDEKVQHYKKIAIMERADGARGKVYGGDDARQLLGLPDGLDVKVRIADLGPYRLFVQSTSVNRKLPRGTTVLYIPSIA